MRWSYEDIYTHMQTITQIAQVIIHPYMYIENIMMGSNFDKFTKYFFRFKIWR